MEAARGHLRRLRAESIRVGLGTAALMHDIGKARVPHEILWKNGHLTDEEWHAMAQHPRLRHAGQADIPGPIQAAELGSGLRYGRQVDTGGFILAQLEEQRLLHVQSPVAGERRGG